MKKCIYQELFITHHKRSYQVFSLLSDKVKKPCKEDDQP